MKILTAAEMREVDRLTIQRLGISGLAAMDNAGKSVADFMYKSFRSLEQRRTKIPCGKGKHGGDGLLAAKHSRLATHLAVSDFSG